jgi:alkyl sulfatase BDS1-like metallo-beta-lactamase superfamily hydrolase
MGWIRTLVVGVLALGLGLVLGRTELGSELGDTLASAGERAAGAALGAAARSADLDIRSRVLAENPSIIPRLAEGGSFGGEFSRAVAQGMFGREEQAIQDALELTKVESLAPRTWLIRMPIVNAVLFETDAGLVLVDTGMAPAGPALLEAIRSVSDAPLHTVIYTHGHVDHAYGTWALIDAGEKPEIIAQERLVDRFERYLRIPGSLARYMSQPEEHLPRSRDDLVWPTRTFRDRLELTIGGERFVLVHHPGETDDQLYVWVPGRSALASADYYQGFLPNAGNGKRVQRDVERWAVALREMAALEPALLLPAHGAAIRETTIIQEHFGVLAEALEHIVQHTLDGLDRGLRKDLIHGSVALPEHLASHPSLNIQYVTPQDISKMVLKKYTGWWDDIPSHWTPAPLADQAKSIVELAGGMEGLATYARGVAARDVRLASHLVDYAFYADPEHPTAQELVLEIYKQRILDPRSNTMEMLEYLGAMTEARAQQLRATDG